MPLDAALGRRADRAGLGRQRRLRGRAVDRRRDSRATSISTSMSRSPRARSAISPGRSRRASTDAARRARSRSSRKARDDGTLARLADRYFAHARPGPAHRRRRVPGAHAHACCRDYRALFHDAQDDDRHRVAPARRASPTRNRNGIRSRPARPACAASCRSPRTRRGTSASATGSIPRASVARRGALPARPEGAGCRRASRSPTARGSRSPRSTSASATSRTRASSRRGRSSIRTCGATCKKALPLLALPEYYEKAQATATRAAACRSRSSTACAATTTSCCAMRRRISRGCARPTTHRRTP